MALIGACGVLACLIALDAGPSQDGLVVSRANAHPSGKHTQKGDKGPAQLQALKGAQETVQQPQTVQQLQTVQKLQAIQQLAATQKKLQQVQGMIAAQQRRVQNVQQFVAARKQAQIANKLAQPAPPNTAPLIVTPIRGPKLNAAVERARNKTYSPVQTQQAKFEQVLAKLKGRSDEGPRQIRQQAVFKLMLAKLSGKRKDKRYEREPEQTAAPTIAAPAPTTSAAAKTTKSVQAALPAVTETMPATSLVAAVSSVAKSGDGSSGSLGNTMSKLGGPQEPKQANEGGMGGGRASKKNDDDDGPDGGIGGALKGVLKPGLPIKLQPLDTLPQVGTYNPKQVVAFNLSAAGLQKVLSMHYKKLGEIDLPLLGGTLTRLETPPDENAVSGISKLQEFVPDSTFALNRVYAPYRLGASGNGPLSGSTVRPGVRCAPDRCFGADMINWQPQLAACTRGIRIGIVDTGIDGTHPAFAGVKFKEKDFTPPGSAEASRDHGTGIFSLLTGLVPHADYSVAYAFYAESKGGPAISDTIQMLAALNWLKERRVAIANLSFAGPKDPLLHVAVRQLAAEGAIIVAAAGNEGPNAPPSYPAAYEEVIAVTAVDRNLAPYRYASRGPHIDVAAPGVGIWTALPGSREGPQTGTSFAVPYVTAVLALNYAALGVLSGDRLAPKQRALEALRASALKIGGAEPRSPIFGVGLVKAPDACPPAPGVAVAKGAPANYAWEGKVVPTATRPAPASVDTGWTTSTVHAATDRRP